MKKFLSVFIAVAMVLSFATMFTASPANAPVAKAASYRLTKAPSWMETNDPNGAQYMSYKVVQYTMGQNIKSAGPGVPAGKEAVLVTGTDYDYNNDGTPDGNYTIVQITTTDALGHFSLATSNVLYDGLYKVVVLQSDAGTHKVGDTLTANDIKDGGNNYFAQYVFIKYVWQLNSPGKIEWNCQSVTFSGYLRFGSGKGASTGKGTVTVNYPDQSVANSSSVQTDGNWAMSVVTDQQGRYLIWVADTYAGDFSGTGDTYDVPNSAGGTTSLISGKDDIAYDSLTTGTTSITIDTIVKPTLIYDDGGANYQEVVIYAKDGYGNPVNGLTLADWSLSGLSNIHYSEIAPGVYKFAFKQNGSIASFKAEKVIGGITVDSNILSIPFKTLTDFNPVVTVDADNSNAPYKFDKVGQYTYDVLPCQIGYSFIVKSGYFDPADSNNYEVNWVNYGFNDDAPVYDMGEAWNPPHVYDVGDHYLETERYMITGQGEIDYKISAEILKRVNPNAPISDYNACCTEKSQDFTICKPQACDVKVEKTSLKPGEKTDLKLDITSGAMNCGCDVVVHITPTNNPHDDFFTLNDGTTAPDLWYNLTGAAANYKLCDVDGKVHHIYPYPYSNDYIDVDFQPTNDNATYIGGVVTFPGITANYCDDLKVEVFTAKRSGGCYGTCTTYPFVYRNPEAISVSLDKVSISSSVDDTGLTAGVPETVTFSGLKLNSHTTMSVYWFGRPWRQADTAYTFINNGDGTATVNFTPPPTYHGIEFTGDNILTVEFDTPTLDGTGCVLRQIAKITINAPEADLSIGTGCGEKIPADGLITEGFAETVTLNALTNPADSSDLLSQVQKLGIGYYNSPDECYLPTVFYYYSPCEGCDTYSVNVVALDNPNVKADPTILPYIKINNVYVFLDDYKMVVTPPTISVDPNSDIPFTAKGEPTTMLKFSAIDAHGKPMCGKTFDIYDINTMNFAASQYGEADTSDLVSCNFDPVPIPNTPQMTEVFLTQITSSFSYHTGVTGSKGTVIYPFAPPYAGMFGAFLRPDAMSYAWPAGWMQTFLKKVELGFETVYKAPVKDTEAPTITITAPKDGATVDTDTVKVEGTVTDNVGVTSLYIGSQKIDFAPDGSFAADVQLSEGENTIKVFAFDAAGNKAEKDITVTYKKPAPVKKTVVTVQIGSDVMTVNGEVRQLDVAPVIHEGHTYLPLRAIAEALGAKVDWIASTKGITITLGKHTVGLQIGNSSAVVDGNVISIFPPYLQPYGDGTYAATMVPLRVIAEGLGATVTWDPATRTVTITLVQSGS